MSIKINIQIFIIIFLLILTNQIEIYSFLMIFALLHELAHMSIGMYLKLKPKELQINPFGVSILFETFEREEKKKIAIALAGPILNLSIAIIFSFINMNTHLKQMIIYSNILLGLFNLIPIYPLDGGRILKSMIRKNHRIEETEKAINQISNMLVITFTMISSVLILIYKNIGLLFLVLYLWILVLRENKRYILKKRVYGVINKE